MKLQLPDENSPPSRIYLGAQVTPCAVVRTDSRRLQAFEGSPPPKTNAYNFNVTGKLTPSTNRALQTHLARSKESSKRVDRVFKSHQLLLSFVLRTAEETKELEPGQKFGR